MLGDLQCHKNFKKLQIKLIKDIDTLHIKCYNNQCQQNMRMWRNWQTRWS